MALLMSDFNLRHHCILWITVVLCITRTASVVNADQISNTRAWSGLHSELKNESPETINSGLDRAELWKPVSLGAGMLDVTATVGRVFKYAVPQDAFLGDNLKYKITEAGRDTLPSWLFYNEVTQTVQGIPSEADLDQYYMQVTAAGRSFNSTDIALVTDIFSISVLPERRVLTTSATLLKETTTSTKGSCDDDEAAIEATIILDANWDKMLPKERQEVVSEMSKHSRLGMDVFRLLPAGSKSLLDGSLMVAGPGNVKREKYPGIALSWKIGCSRTNNVDKFPVVTVLETASKDGSMASKLKHDIIGWRVTNDRPDRLRRVRRQAKLMGTPMPTPMPSITTPKPTMVKETTTLPPKPTMTITRSFTVVEPTPSIMPTATRSSITLRPTPTASPVYVTPTPMVTSSPHPKPTASSAVPTVVPSQSVMKTRTSMPEPTPTPTVPMVTTSPTTPPMVTPSASPTLAATTPIVAIDTTAAPPTTLYINNAPTVNRRLKRVEAMEGKLLNFTIRRNTFSDIEDGDTRNLSLLVLTFELNELPAKFWLKFDKKSQTLYGLPLKEQAKEKRFDLILVAQDSQGLQVRNPFEVVVAAAPSIEDAPPPPVKMGMTLDIDYDEFINNPQMQLFILNKIAKAFGDSNADAITITEIKRGSVIISWVNNTLPTDQCNNELILELQSKIMTPDGKPTQALIDAFLPEFNITEVESVPLGVCASTTPVMAVVTTTADPGLGGGSNQPNDMWISTVLPAVVIAVILLIAGVIIFILYRKSRKGKLSDEDQNTFINKGIPIIFADEIEDGEKQPSSGSPLIMKTEKPPLSPPEYTETQQPLLNSSNQPGGGEEDDKHSLPMVDMSGTPSYQPPPPLSPSPPENRSNVPPRDISSYRKPPAYVHIQP
ncbi:dystroglycan 1-like [Asterias amurensis]|uniref:dystroglycan 1-like n=1 Tax=Asterias amurensis TaxID=7602 RepID=UPI003AB64A01